MIDEIDKMGADWRGDPSSAMLEVLDPEQNVSFRDHYMDLPFDLSRVLFITTANQLEPVPAPLRDRMEIINLAGYTIEEKLHIAKTYLVPAADSRPTASSRARSRSRTRPSSRSSPSYTREAGVRNVEREIGTICRKLAREVAEASNGSRRRFTVNVKRVHDLLGRPRTYSDVKRRTSDPGVATGLAWTPVGGDILFIEATAMPGNGHLTVTGQLGDVMKESAHGGDELRAHALAGAGPRGRLLPDARHPHPRAGRRHPQGRAQRRRDHGHRHLLAGHRHAGQQRRRHDRRGHAHRPGAAHRRPQGEDPRRAARRHHHGDPAEPQRGRPRGRARGAAQGHDVRARRPRRAGLAGGHGPQAGHERAAELIEAGDLIEEAGELLEKARRKAGNRAGRGHRRRAAGAEARGRSRPAAKKPRRRSRRQEAARQEAGVRPAPAGREARSPRRRRPSPRAPPRRPRPPAAAAAARSSRRGAPAAAACAEPTTGPGRRCLPGPVCLSARGRDDRRARRRTPRTAPGRGAGRRRRRSCLREARRIRWRGPAPAPPARSSRRDQMADEPTQERAAPRTRRRWRAPRTLARAVPSFAVLADRRRGGRSGRP